jgi:putative FmdB family regulatory protein
MPIYEFICEPCNAVFEELFRSASEKRKVVCPRCGGDDVKKKMSVFGTRTGGEGGGTSSAGGCGSCSASSCKGCR